MIQFCTSHDNGPCNNFFKYLTALCNLAAPWGKARGGGGGMRLISGDSLGCPLGKGTTDDVATLSRELYCAPSGASDL